VSLYLFVVLSLSVWRWTHLIVEDTIPIVAKPREWIVRRKPMGNLAYLVGCTWCSSVWVAAAHVGVLYAYQDEVVAPVALGAAFSLIAGVGETFVGWLDKSTPVELQVEYAEEHES
jgi:hypothetical protein